MENNYFKPDTEDLRIGYECEIGNKGYAEDFQGKNWRNIIIGKKDAYRDDSFPYYDLFVDYEDGLEDIRVQYLTKEQIESEGWDYDRQSSDILYFDRRPYTLEYNLTNRILLIGGDLHYPSYRGECKDINTFRFLVKLLRLNEKSI